MSKEKLHILNSLFGNDCVLFIDQLYQETGIGVTVNDGRLSGVVNDNNVKLK